MPKITVVFDYEDEEELKAIFAQALRSVLNDESDGFYGSPDGGYELHRWPEQSEDCRGCACSCYQVES